MGTALLHTSAMYKSVRWIISHFSLVILLMIAGIWDFLLWSTTRIHFDRNIQDFGRFYFATKAFLSGQDMYGPTQGTFLPISPLFAEHLWDLNPPHFHLLFYPLTDFSPHEALTIWACISLLALLLCGYFIITELRISLSWFQWGLVVLALLAFSATGFLIRTAQVSLILMLPATLAWRNARRNNWARSGFYLGLLASMKLFFLVFLPYLLLRRHYRGTAVFVLSCLSCFTLGLLVFGADSYISWIRILGNIEWAGGSTNASLLGFLTRAFSDNPHFQPLHANLNIYPLWVFGAGCFLFVTIISTSYDFSPTAVDRGFSLLLIGAIFASPLGWTYYFFLPIGPMVALAYSWKTLREQKRTPFQLRACSFRNTILLLAIPGLFFPSTMGARLQPNAWATLFIASIYFWTTLFVWIALICDWRIQNEMPKIRFPIFAGMQARTD